MFSSTWRGLFESDVKCANTCTVIMVTSPKSFSGEINYVFIFFLLKIQFLVGDYITPSACLPSPSKKGTDVIMAPGWEPSALISEPCELGALHGGLITADFDPWSCATGFKLTCEMRKIFFFQWLVEDCLNQRWSVQMYKHNMICTVIDNSISNIENIKFDAVLASKTFPVSCSPLRRTCCCSASSESDEDSSWDNSPASFLLFFFLHLVHRLLPV